MPFPPAATRPAVGKAEFRPTILAAFITRRLIFLFFVLFGVSALIFGILMTFGPERRAAAFISSPNQVKDIPLIIQQYGLDDPFYVQYGRWIKEVVKGNLGWSIVASKPVWEAFWQYFWVTLELNLYASPLIIALGIWLGTITGIHRDTPVDHITRIFAVIGWSLPTFLFALILMMIFYGYFGIFPPGTLDDQMRIFIEEHGGEFRNYTNLLTIDGLLNRRLDITLDALRRLVLPVFTEVVVIVALLVRVMRSSMIEELSKDYVVTALAKGAAPKTVYFRHARKNALIPVVTVSGWVVAFMMEGSISVEIVFNRKGLGWWLAHSATQLDMPVLMAMCLFMGLVYVFTNLVIDILYAYIDPRIRLD